MRVNERKLIEHPDDLIDNKLYSVAIHSGNKLRRVQGKFKGFQLIRDCRTPVPIRATLGIVLQRSIDTMLIPWPSSKDWREL